PSERRKVDVGRGPVQLVHFINVAASMAAGYAAGATTEEVPVLKWLIFGCGGVGGYFGARLAQQGQHVSFMARNQALAALRKHGVRIKSICGDLT
ncbi:unnamed protein product, partial [Polarella glacialis]